MSPDRDIVGEKRNASSRQAIGASSTLSGSSFHSIGIVKPSDQIVGQFPTWTILLCMEYSNQQPHKDSTCLGKRQHLKYPSPKVQKA
jgi:hypothetical protein